MTSPPTALRTDRWGVGQSGVAAISAIARRPPAVAGRPLELCSARAGGAALPFSRCASMAEPPSQTQAGGGRVPLKGEIWKKVHVSRTRSRPGRAWQGMAGPGRAGQGSNGNCRGIGPRGSLPSVAALGSAGRAGKDGLGTVVYYRSQIKQKQNEI